MHGNAMEIRGVAKKFGHHVALDTLHLTVSAGEFFGLVGGNGAGKTTLIKGILGLYPFDTGHVRIFGVDHLLVHARRHVAYLPERFHPPRFLAGYEFLRHMTRLHGRVWDRHAAEAISVALDMAASTLNKPVRTLSKGMTQKLGLAACLLSNKPLLLLDEPMSGLDPKARVLLKRHLFDQKRKAGTTLFFNTHLLADVAEMCDRMGILNRGGLCFVGTPDDCLTRYGGATLEEAYLRCIQADDRDSNGKNAENRP